MENNIVLYTALNFAACIIEFVVGIQYFEIFWTRCVTRKKLFLVTIGNILALTVVNCFSVAILNTLTIFMLFVILGIICFTCKLKDALFLGLGMTSLSVLAEGASAVLTRYVFHIDIDLLHQAVQYYMVSLVGGKIILLFLINLISFLYKGFKREESTSISLIFLVFPLVSILTIYMMVFLNPELSSSSVRAVALVGTAQLVVNVFAIKIYQNALEQSDTQHKLQIAQLVIQAEQAFGEQQENNEEILRKERHEFKSMLLNACVMYRQQEDGVLEFLEKMMSSLDKTSEDLNVTTELQNKMVNSILNRYRKICEENNITFSIDIQYLDLAFINVLDTSTLLNNSLDNAVAGCLTVPEDEERFIRLSIYREHDQVVIAVWNSRRNELRRARGKLLSSKADSHNHGFGIGNMESSAANYDGTVSFLTDRPQEFQLFITLKVNES